MVLPPRPFGPNRFQDGASALVWFTLRSGGQPVTRTPDPCSGSATASNGAQRACLVDCPCVMVAEGTGFEPAWLLHPFAFQATPIGLSGTLPCIYLLLDQRGVRTNKLAVGEGFEPSEPFGSAR